MTKNKLTDQFIKAMKKSEKNNVPTLDHYVIDVPALIPECFDNQWINVADRKPYSEQMIVVMRDDGRPYAGRYSIRNDYCIDRFTGHWVGGFTYWMPLELPATMQSSKESP